MKTERALLIVGQDTQSAYHHRGQHLASYLARRFDTLDIVSITKMYDGPGTDPVWKKGLLGLRDTFYKRIKIIPNGNVVDYVVRFPRLPGILDYLLRDSWTYVNVRKHLKNHYDVCVLAHPRLALVGLQLRKQGIAETLVYDDWDYFPGIYPNDISWRQIMDYREQICVRAADAVVSVSSLLQDLRRKQGAKRTALVPNGVDYSLFQTAQQKKPHPPTLLYMGSLADSWGADLPIQALPIIRKQLPDVRYVLIGSGPSEDRLREMTEALCLQDNVLFCGYHEYKYLPRFLAEADIGVATSRDDKFRKYACPMKIIEYMAGGLPVIGTRFEGETQIIIEKAMAGETVEFSPNAFANAVLDILSNRSKYELYSANAVKFAIEHDWMKLLYQEFAFIEQLRNPQD